MLTPYSEVAVTDVNKLLKLPKGAITLSALIKLLVWVIPVIIKAFERFPLSSSRRHRLSRVIDVFFSRLKRGELQPDDARINSIKSLGKWVRSRVSSPDDLFNELRNSADGRMILSACEYFFKSPDDKISSYAWISEYHDQLC